MWLKRLMHTIKIIMCQELIIFVQFVERYVSDNYTFWLLKLYYFHPQTPINAHIIQLNCTYFIKRFSGYIIEALQFDISIIIYIIIVIINNTVTPLHKQYTYNGYDHRYITDICIAVICQFINCIIVMLKQYNYVM
jgi:hypothetical protein